MLAVKCIQKFRDRNNKIYGYRLQDSNGYTKDVRPEDLKAAIANNKVSVVNLTLTSDGRLLDKKVPEGPFEEFLNITCWNSDGEDISEIDGMREYICTIRDSSIPINVCIYGFIAIDLCQSIHNKLEVHMSLSVNASSDDIKAAARYIEDCIKNSKVPYVFCVVENGKVIPHTARRIV